VTVGAKGGQIIDVIRSAAVEPYDVIYFVRSRKKDSTVVAHPFLSRGDKLLLRFADGALDAIYG
jgi:hypothetical protein